MKIKMKTKILLMSFLLLLGTGLSAGAQQLRGGINFANVSVNDNGRVADANMLTSFQVGLIGDWRLGTGLLSLQPGIVFTGKGSKIERGTAGQNGYYRQSSNPNYIEVPVNVVAKLPIGGGAKFFAGAGPYLGVGVGGKNKTEGQNPLGTYNRETDIRFSDDDPTTLNEEEGTGFGVLKRFDYGLNGTAGIEGKSVVLGVNYGHGLAKLQSGTNNNEDNNNKHRVLSVTLGFKF
jgi:hypothetical protein